MASKDFNNGLITGLAMKGLPYGVSILWQPKSITNEDTQSITIDFDRNISGATFENMIPAIVFAVYSYNEFGVESPTVLPFHDIELINPNTIKFYFDDYINYNSPFTIIFSKNRGALSNVASFVCSYYPEGVAIKQYRRELIEGLVLSAVTLNVASLTMGCDDALQTTLADVINLNFSEPITVSYSTLTIIMPTLSINPATSASATVYEEI